MLRLALRRGPALVAGCIMLAPAIVVAVGDFGWESWLTDGLGLVVGATGAAMVMTGLAGPQADWVDPDEQTSHKP